MRWTVENIRQSFLDFFANAAIGRALGVDGSGERPDVAVHQCRHGAVQGRLPGQREARPVVDCQKCLRMSGKHNDLEAVGRDTYHHTFFEMLGNWSFGDYYKKEAIAWHWELMTKVWGFAQAALRDRVHDDDEAEAGWNDDRLGQAHPPFRRQGQFLGDGRDGAVRAVLGDPHRSRRGHMRAGAHPGDDVRRQRRGCDRFIESGNLVFIQYNRDASGKLTPLPMKHVDTGSGLERVAAAVQSIEAAGCWGITTSFCSSRSSSGSKKPARSLGRSSTESSRAMTSQSA